MNHEEMAYLSKELIDEITSLILEYKKPEKVVIFGSRARDTFGRTSDIDIAIFGQGWSDKDHYFVKNQTARPKAAFIL